MRSRSLGGAGALGRIGYASAAAAANPRSYMHFPGGRVVSPFSGSANPFGFTFPFSGTWLCAIQGARAGKKTSDGTGGGAGGLAVKTLPFASGSAASFSIASNAAIATDAAGSTLTLPGGIVLTANGGKTGVSGAGGIGGTATGGDFNYTGGNGGLTNQSGAQGGGPAPYPIDPPDANGNGGNGSFPGILEIPRLTFITTDAPFPYVAFIWLGA